ncbi:ProP effector [Serratia ficaria]|uniref:ProQ/FINO family protein n=1 Tax=Serratia ficaria TaxID=61651 RepID=UPI00217A7A7D|nr:ProQ/FINO family protein [Serratia ficaria]CAI1224571.1 ProP effector [Serratia ficaria]CAI1241611.1 ProP effector [Serratia ficaria]CAI2032141.1 ProP effector [Serratia ficaria]CAI2539497.1 ProP effector [Serratia ficaria]CAI2539923.1 ProP effector [Serratia ficaria]
MPENLSSADVVVATPDTAKPARNKKQRRTARSWANVDKVATVFPLLWPDADARQFRPVKNGIHADVSAWIAANPQAGLSEEEWKQSVRFLVSRLEYLRTVTAGTPRVDLSGEPAGTVTASEENHARRNIAAIRARFVKKPRSPEKDPSRRDTD